MKKGQAAMEFIMTYGWAILAVLAAIGALAYFGVLNPGKYAPDKCLFKTGLSCSDFQLVQTGTNNLDPSFILQNNIGEPIVLSGPGSVTVERNGVSANCGIAAATTIGAGDSVDLGANGGGASDLNCPALTGVSPGVGQSAKVKINVTYVKAQGTYPQKSVGEITAVVQ